jgi:phosphoglycolate phosphatase
MVRLVLFDIDGTLIRSGGAGVRAFEQTFAEVFNLPEATRRLKFAGRTDVSLVREAFVQSGLEPNPENFRRFFEAYPPRLKTLLGRTQGGVIEGMREFLDELYAVAERPVIGLLTGNIRLGAQLKLSHYGLWERFETGAFADDHEDRNCIAGVAKQRGEEMLGRPLAGNEIVVIGDTPLDIACATSIGARCLAVSTGGHPLEELLPCSPTWAVRNVRDVPMAEILGRQAKIIAEALPARVTPI